MSDHPAPSDEGRHLSSLHPLWNESWYFDFHDTDATFGGYVRMGLYPNLGVSWFWACVVGAGRPLVFVGDHEAPLPRSDQLELRAPGLWTDISCLEPLERFSVQLEAFGVGVDDPAEMYGRMRGEQVPVGFDLEWETDGGVFGYPEGITRYEVPCEVHGEILVGPERIDFEGFGQRDHSWGIRDWWSFPWCWFSARLDSGERLHCLDLGNGGRIGYRARGGDFEFSDLCAAEMEFGRHGFAERASVLVDTIDCEVRPVAWAPVLLLSPDGRELARLARWCRWSRPPVVVQDGSNGTNHIWRDRQQRRRAVDRDLRCRGRSGGRVDLGRRLARLAMDLDLVDVLVDAHFRVVRFDNRDCGLSTKIDADELYTLDDMARDVVGLMDALAIDRAHLVGRSMGGMIGQLLALDHGRRVRSLALLITSPGMGDDRLPGPGEAFLDALAARQLAPPPKTHDERVEYLVELFRLYAGTAVPFDEARLRAACTAEVERMWYPESGHGFAAWSTTSRIDRLAEITVPTLIMHGTADPVVPVAHAHCMAEAIPDNECWIIEGLGHETPAALTPELARRLLALFSRAP